MVLRIILLAFLFFNISLSNTIDVNKETYLSYISKYNSKDAIKINEIINLNLNNFFPEHKEELKKIITSQCKIESEFRENIIGDQGRSFGIMQVMLTTAKHIALKFKPMKKYRKYSDKQLTAYLKTYEGSIEFGISYLAYKKKYINYQKISDYGKFFKMISLYNGGIYNFTYVDKVFKEVEVLELELL